MVADKTAPSLGVMAPPSRSNCNPLSSSLLTSEVLCSTCLSWSLTCRVSALSGVMVADKTAPSLGVRASSPRSNCTPLSSPLLTSEVLCSTCLSCSFTCRMSALSGVMVADKTAPSLAVIASSPRSNCTPLSSPLLRSEVLSASRTSVLSGVRAAAVQSFCTPCSSGCFGARHGKEPPSSESTTSTVCSSCILCSFVSFTTSCSPSPRLALVSLS